MYRVRLDVKRTLALSTITGLTFLLILVMATAAQGGIGFLSTPIGQPPTPAIQRVQANETVRYAGRTATVTVSTPAPKPVPVVSSGRCGGSLPTCKVMQCESGGDLRVRNRRGSSASGKWQIVRGTWNGYGGYAEARDAPEHVQDAKARELWAGGKGAGHWRACL